MLGASRSIRDSGFLDLIQLFVSFGSIIVLYKGLVISKEQSRTLVTESNLEHYKRILEEAISRIKYYELLRNQYYYEFPENDEWIKSEVCSGKEALFTLKETLLYLEAEGECFFDMNWDEIKHFIKTMKYIIRKSEHENKIIVDLLYHYEVLIQCLLESFKLLEKSFKGFKALNLEEEISNLRLISETFDKNEVKV